MAITTTVPDYTGNTPVIGQPQPEFNQNTADIFDYIGSVSTSINDVASEMNSTATQVSNDASSASSSATSAAASADEAGAFSAGIINFAGDFVVGVTSAVSGSSYRYDGGYWTCVSNTTSTPSLNNSAWRKVIGQDDIDASEERAIGAGVSIYRGSNGSYVQNGDSVPVGTTHLAVLIDGKVEDVAMSPVSAGVVSLLTETSATVGVTTVKFSNFGYKQFPYLYNSNGELVVDNAVSIGDRISVENYYQDGTSGILFFRVVAASTGIHDGGKYIDLPLSNLQLEQNVRLPVFAEAWGVDPKLSDNGQNINNALAYGDTVFIGDGEFDIQTNVKIPANKNLIGTSKNGTIINITSDIVGVTVLTLASLRNLRVTGKDGISTKNNIEVGSATESGARSIIDNVYTDRAGNDGLQVVDGNLGTIRDTHAVINGRDGVHFTLDTHDNNNWTFEGYNDWRDNVRDGINLEQGSSAFDVLAPKSHSGNFSVQNNGRYGAYIGTRSNVLTIYAENNGSDGVYLDTYGIGNEITLLEGTATDVTGNNQVSTPNASGNAIREWTSKVRLSGGAGKGLRLTNSDGTAGFLDFEKTAVRNYKFIAGGSSANHFLILENSDSLFSLELVVGGIIRHTTDNKWSFGTSSIRSSVVYSATGTINTSDAREKADRHGRKLVSESGNISEVSEFTSDEIEAAKELSSKIGIYKWIEAIDKKGDAARLHIGMTVQTAIAIMEKHNLDPFSYGFICYDKWDRETDIIDGVEIVTLESGDRYGIRYEQLTAFMLRGMHERMLAAGI